MNKRALGTEKEELAAQYLTKQGMKILERNFRCRQGEIDIIGVHNSYLVFVEVKYRKTTAKGSAKDAVHMQKQRKICQVADYYRYSHKISVNTSVRYDVLAIQGEQIEWIQNAFSHVWNL